MSVQETTDTQQESAQADTHLTEQPTPVVLDGADDSQEPKDAAEAQQDRDEKGRFKGVQPRIDELTRKRHEAEREAAYWRGVATQGKVPTSADKPAAPQKPTPEQFNDYAEFVEALTDWKTGEKVSKAMSERDAKAAEMQQAQTRQASWSERQTAARSAMPDYDAVVGAATTPIAGHVAEALLESEHGPALAYHFAKHPDALERLNGLAPRQADREIGRLEERLASGAIAAPADPMKTSNAPKPAGTMRLSGSSNPSNLATAPMDEYMRQRKAQGARWAR